MIDIHEARQVTELNKNKSTYLPRWVENYVDDKIMDAASYGRSSLCLRFDDRRDRLSDEEINAVLESYADYSPRYFSGGCVFYFFWDED